MTILGYRGLTILFFLTRTEPTLCGPSVQKRLTLHNGKTTWNHANEICENNSKNLLTMDNQDVVDAIKDFNSDDAVWDGELEDFWIGLHDNNDDPDVADYVWKGCEALGSYTPWHNQDKRDVERCIRAKKSLNTDDIWETRKCAAKDGFVICEEDIGPCSFVYRSHATTDTRGSAVTEKVTETTKDGCETRCLNYFQDGKECWGYSHIISWSQCVLHIGETLAEFQASWPFAKYIKSCFIGETGNDVKKVKYETPDDNDPWKGCTYLTSPPTLAWSNATTHAATTRKSTETTVVKINTTTSAVTETTTRLSSQNTTSLSHVTSITTSTHDAGLKASVDSTSTTGKSDTQASIDSSMTTGETSTQGNTDSSMTTGKSNTRPNTDSSMTTGKSSTRPNTDSAMTTTETSTRPNADSYMTTGKASTRPNTDSSMTMGKSSTQPNTDSSMTTSVSTLGNTSAGISSFQATDRTRTGGQLFPASGSTMAETLTIVTSKASIASNSTVTAGTTTEDQHCMCVCSNLNKLTNREKELFIQRILKNLTIARRHISAVRRKFISAHDPRLSAKTVGSAGLVILSLILVGVFILDFCTLARDVKLLFTNISRRSSLV